MTTTFDGNTAHLRPSDKTLLQIKDLVVEFDLGGGRVVKAVSNVSLDLVEGETLSIVGESGCGKSTLGKAILQLPAPTSGSIVFQGTDITKLSKKDLRNVRPAMQMIFQDPVSSLDPRFTVSKIVKEPLEIWSRGTDSEQETKIDELLNSVGLDPTLVRERHAYEFSGGQCQ